MSLSPDADVRGADNVTRQHVVTAASVSLPSAQLRSAPGERDPDRRQTWPLSPEVVVELFSKSTGTFTPPRVRYQRQQTLAQFLAMPLPNTSSTSQDL